MGLFSQAKPDKVKSKLLKAEGCVATLSIEIPPVSASAAAEAETIRFQRAARVPGFRQGKAPIEVIRRHFAGRVREAAVEALLRAHVPEAVREHAPRAVEPPVVEEVSWEEGASLSVRVTVEIAPEATAKDYLKIPVERRRYPADPAAVAKKLEEIREAHARLEPSAEEVLGKGHFAVIDYALARAGAAPAKGRSELVDMSAPQTIEGLAEGLLGLRRGESRAFPVKISGQAAELTAELKDIKAKVLPAADEEFAKDLGFDGLPALEAKLREMLEKEGAARAESEVAAQIEAALLKSNPFPLPPSMVARQLDGMLERMRLRLFGGAAIAGKPLEELRAKLLPRAEDEVRLAFILAAVREKEKIDVSEDELKDELDRALASEPDAAKKAEITAAYARRKDALAHALRERKAMAFLREKASYKDA